MKIFFHRPIILCLLMVFVSTTFLSQDAPRSLDEEIIAQNEEEVDWLKKIDPAYFPYFLGGIIALIVGGMITAAIISNKRERTKRDYLVSQINKAYKSGEILDADYDEIKKGLDPIQYKWLVRTFDFAIANKRRYDFLHSKYPKDIATDLFEQKHRIGMTIEQLIDSRGHPKRTEEEILKTKTTKTFIYESPVGEELFSFVGGVLEKYDRK